MGCTIKGIQLLATSIYNDIRICHTENTEISGMLRPKVTIKDLIDPKTVPFKDNRY